jgi:membrane-bound metal-dependent hydrolase YbcI (DUF457 family)
MPSPLGHALGGVICALAIPTLSAGASRSATWVRVRGVVAPRTLAIAVVAGCLPDADFLWGRHNMETHSVGAALLAGAVTLAASRGRQPRLAAVVVAAWLSHVLFDWLGSDDTPPVGVMALWPWSSAFYFADAFVFEAISRRYWLPGFWAHNLWALLTEAAMLVPIVAGLAWWRRRDAARSGRVEAHRSD